RRPFDLERGPLWRFRLVRLAADGRRHAFLFAQHHVVSDGWSINLFLAELREVYAAFADGLPSPLPELSLGYADFAVWQRGWLDGAVLGEQLDFWRRELAGLPPLELPTDRPRPAVQSQRGASFSFTLPAAVPAALAAFASKTGASPFMLLTAAFQTLLGRHSGQTRFAVGSPIAGRNRTELEPIVGFFVNTLVLAADLDPGESFDALARRTRDRVLAAHAHQDLPFEKLVEELAPRRDLSTTPLFQVMFALQNLPSPGSDMAGVRLSRGDLAPPSETAKFDLGVSLQERRHGAGRRLGGTVEYARDLFDRATVERLIGHFGRLLEAALTEPQTPLAELPLLAPGERQQILREWGGEPSGYPRDATLATIFAATVAAHGDRPALTGPGEDGEPVTLTYGELDRRATALARRLVAEGVGPEVRVGLLLDRSIEAIVAIVAVAKAGGAYLPLDPAYPEERLAFLLEDAAPQVVVTRPELANRLPENPLATVVCVPADEVPVDSSALRESTASDSRNLAYVMYTSGSTGTPKGVAVTQQGVARLVLEPDYVELGPEETILQVAPLPFDASTGEIWCALASGARLVLAPSGLLDVGELGRTIADEGVTRLWLTSGLFHQMVDAEIESLAGVRQILAGGDVVSVPHVARVLEELPGCRMTACYGPTENTLFTTTCTLRSLADLPASVPLGRPIADTRVYVLDRSLAPVPPGVTGSIYTAGDGLARGYLGRPGRTAESFLPDPLGQSGERMYRTGDLGRWLPDGRLEFAGRDDHQVKVRGYRIELGEVETALAGHPRVRTAVVLALGDGAADKRLVGYATPAPGGEPPTAAELGAHLAEHLPAYMVPTAFVVIDEMPRTANDKIDRRALAALGPGGDAGRRHVAPRTLTEARLVKLWAEVLHLDEVGAEDDFFDLGGHSLLATRLEWRISRDFGVKVPVRRVFELRTLAALGAEIDAAEAAVIGDELPLVPLPREGQGANGEAGAHEFPASFAQQRLWVLDRLDPGRATYAIPSLFRFDGPLDVPVLAAALTALTRRQESLRTVFTAVGEHPLQRILPAPPPGETIDLPRFDLSALPAARRAAEAERVFAAEARRPFDLERGPLWRFRLLHLGIDEHRLVVDQHHVVSDGWSLGVFVRELAALYRAAADGTPAGLEPLPVQCADHAVWQRRRLAGPKLDAAIDWWSGELAGLPVLDLPTDRPRPPVASERGGHLSFRLPDEVAAAAERFARERGVTPFVLIAAAFQALLGRWAGQDDFALGTPVSGRERPELEELIGFFVNTLVLRSRLAGDAGQADEPGFGALVDRVRDSLLDAQSHGEVPFERLVEALSPGRDLATTPLFQVLMAVESWPAGDGGLDLGRGVVLRRAAGSGTGSARCDLAVSFETTPSDDERPALVGGVAEYATDLFDRSTVERLVGHLGRLLAAALDDPQAPLAALPILSPAERRQLVDVWPLEAGGGDPEAAVFVLDDRFEPVPALVVGELCVGAGAGDAAADARPRRSGELARWRPDGTLERLGRRDERVVIGGYRIVPVEVERALARHPEVQRAAVSAPARPGGEGESDGEGGGDGERWLVAHVETAAEPAELAAWFGERFPAHLLPAAWCVLDALPLTAAGEIDRAALDAVPVAPVDEGDADEAPRGEAEERVAALFAEVLGIEPGGTADGQPLIGRGTDFFQLGGHSLLATALAVRLRDAFGVQVGLRQVFKTPTVASLAAAVAGGGGESGAGEPEPELVALPRDAAGGHRGLPLSFAQQRLWFLDRLDPGKALYSIPALFRLDGPLDRSRLAAALTEVARVQESLRTRLVDAGDAEPVQVIEPPRPVALPLVDLSALADEPRRRELARRGRAEALRPFDLERGPLWRFLLFRLGHDEHRFFVNQHHVVSDGWSFGLFLRQLAEAWQRLGDGGRLDAPPVQYADHAAWQRRRLSGAVLERRLDDERRRLGGVPVLELPFDRPRPALPSGRGDTVSVVLPPPVAAGVRRVAGTRGATLYMTLLAAFEVLLARFTGQRDFAVGSPVAGRNRVEVEGIIGFFVNTLVQRADLAGDPGFGELVGRVREQALAAAASEELPFERLVEAVAPGRDLATSPLVQVMFSFHNLPPLPAELHLGEARLSASRENASPESAKFDLELSLVERGDGLQATFGYAADLFDRATVERFAAAFARLTAAAVADPEVPCSALPLLAAAERRQLLTEWARHESDYPRERTLAEVFRATVAAHGERVALVDAEGGETTYRELGERAEALARRLAAHGVGPEVRVALLLERSPEAIVAIAAVALAGGAYLPLDPDLPPERLAFLLEDAAPEVVVTRRELADLLPQNPLLTVLLYSSDEVPVDSSALRESTASEVPVEVPVDSSRAVDSRNTDSRNTAYVMYTSGSTGTPKGVAVTQRGVVRLVLEPDFVDLGPEETILQVAPLSFDASTGEIWCALASGAKLVLAATGTVDPAELGRRIAATGVTRLWLTSGLFHRMVDSELPSLAGVRQILAGGDVVSVAHVERVLAERPDLRMTACYGPTENTLFSTTATLTGGDELRGGVPLGRPIADSEVYVLDERFEPVPVGVVGDVCVAGDGLARGYLGRPALTAEAFVPHPHGAAGERLYRTGDRGRWSADGRLEFAGRVDDQVKVRGYRIEPGEVETVLGACPGVTAAVVLALGDGAADKRLVAYLRLAEGAELAAVEATAAERLPGYMLPSAFVEVAEMPRTANDKVDRRALAALAPTAAGGVYAAPATPLEETLAALFAEVLGVERVGVEDDFFRLGGHSLLAARLMAVLRREHGFEVPLRSLFEAPTVRGLAALLGDGEPAQPRRTEVSKNDRALSFAQRRLWFLDRLEPGGSSYNMPLAIRLQGPLDAAVLGRALDELARRQDALRTVVVHPGGEPRQRVLEPAPVALPRVDLAALPTARRHDELDRLTDREARRPFDLERGPLWRFHLFTLAPCDHSLLLNPHHVVSDGWSIGVFERELAALYAAFAAGRPSPLADLEIQYADFAERQVERLRGGELERQLDHWRERLAGVPRLELPTDRPRPAVVSSRGGECTSTWPAPLADGLRKLARDCDATPFAVVLAAFQVLLGRYARQRDFAVGTPTAGRTRAELEPVIGFFVNTLVLRADLGDDPSFAELVRRGRESLVEAHAHQEVPFERLVEVLEPRRDLSTTPLFQAFLSFADRVMDAPLVFAESGDGVLRGRLEPLSTGDAKFDLALAVGADPGGGLRTLWSYRSDLFDVGTVRRMGQHLETLLAAAVAQPERRVSELDLFSAAERHQLLAEWSDGGSAAGASVNAAAEATLWDLFAAQATATPEATALVGPAGERWSYRRLAAAAEAIAARLAAEGVGPEVRVAVCLERTPRLVAALLGVLAAGGAYVPLDPAYPAERLTFMLADSAARAALVETATEANLPEFAGTVLRLGEDGEIEGGEIEGEAVATAPVPHRAAAGNLAYLIYTSGSTGKPKGVAIAHAPAVAMVRWAHERFSGEELAGVLAATSVCFDLSVYELFAPLTAGGTAILATNVLYLPEHPAAGEVTMVNTVPSAMTELVRGDGVPASVAAVNLAGEPLPRRLADEVYALGHVGRLHNLYGPSEDTTYSTWALVRRDDGKPPIGRPLAGTRAYVLDRRLQPVPPGVPGELYLAGAGLARGYLGRPALTAGRWLPEPFGSAQPGGRMYRTGDLVRWRDAAGGELDFLGRVDHQVKVRGFRIELGEIETALLSHPAVREAAVLARPGGDESTLAAYVALEAGAEADGEALADHVAAALPEPMVPTAWKLLGELPLLPNGKVDRRALAAVEADRLHRGAGDAPPRGASEELVAAAFAELTGAGDQGGGTVSRDDDFFRLGGHSLLVVRLLSHLRAALGVELPVRRVFESPTVAGLAKAVDEALAKPPAAGEEPPLVALPRPDDGPVELPASFAQRRLWFLDRLEPGSTAYSMPRAFRLRGGLAPAALAAALTDVARHQESLRTRFADSDEMDEGEPRQVIDPPAPVALPLADLSALPSARREAEARRLAAADAARPFDLERGPLWRFALLRLAADEHVFLVAAHHAVSDGWSLGVFRRQLATAWAARREGRAPELPEPAIRYADHAAWQRERLTGAALERQLAFWRRRLAAVRPLALPTDRPRPAVAGSAGAERLVRWSPAAAEALDRLAAEHGVTHFVAGLAIFQALLARSAGQRDFAVGTPVAGRDRAESEGLIGLFVNTLVLPAPFVGDGRGDGGGDPTVGELMVAVRETAIDAQDHADVPFEKLVDELAPRRDLSSTPLFQAMFQWDESPPAGSSGRAGGSGPWLAGLA
ncbi:MAG TPA: amino acid adenylation domain-containing protein, partial [Thermoanaerobaculia bacterium]|nr:amino acid adenylation domain-containing protein [Thermoanaerobaculia bacterium]